MPRPHPFAAQPPGGAHACGCCARAGHRRPRRRCCWERQRRHVCQLQDDCAGGSHHPAGALVSSAPHVHGLGWSTAWLAGCTCPFRCRSHLHQPAHPHSALTPPTPCPPLHCPPLRCPTVFFQSSRTLRRRQSCSTTPSKAAPCSRCAQLCSRHVRLLPACLPALAGATHASLHRCPLRRCQGSTLILVLALPLRCCHSTLCLPSNCPCPSTTGPTARISRTSARRT